MQPNAQAYDQAKTVFSPDGRLFQVEYAREAVKRGTPAVGIRFDKGVVVLVNKRIPSSLIEAVSIEKIFKVDHHVVCATSGLVADARVLVDRARVDAQQERITYGDRIPIPALVKRIGDFKQAYAQAGGVRPFGTSLIVGGVDDSGPHLYETDPSGATLGITAAAVGAGRTNATEVLEDGWEKDIKQDDAVQLGLRALMAAMEGDVKAETVECAIVTHDTDFGLLDNTTIQKHLDKVKEKGVPKPKGDSKPLDEDLDVSG